MGEDSVAVPLWSDDGLMFAVPDELVRELGVSADLASDIVTWAREWQVRSAAPDHDAQAARLVRRLGRELNYRFEFVYKP